jgi:hypothetical protein
MFLIILFLLTVGQLYFEFKIVRALGLTELTRRFVFLNLGFSILISIGAMTLFPAAGMIVAASGILSTVLSQPMYGIVDSWEKNGKPKTKAARAKYDKNKEQIHQTLSDLAKIAVGVAIILTLPFRILRWCINAIESSKTWLSRKSNTTTPEVV